MMAKDRLIKCVVLVPLRYNDGTCVEESTLSKIEDEIFVAFGGHTVAGTVKGAYRMRDGTKQVDESLKMEVLVPGDDGVKKLRALARRFGRLLDQESMYFEVTTSEVELLPPEPSGGDLDV